LAIRELLGQTTEGLDDVLRDRHEGQQRRSVVDVVLALLRRATALWVECNRPALLARLRPVVGRWR